MLGIKERIEVEKDLFYAKNLKEINGYSKYSQQILNSTDNITAIKKQILHFKKCLIIAGSGEASIELAKNDAEVFSFDLNKLNGYSQELRISALLSLEYDEFMDYYFGLYKNKILSEKLYWKIRENITEKSRIYYDSLYNKLGTKQLFETCFDINMSYESYQNLAPKLINSSKCFFSYYNEKEFYKTKEKDLHQKIHFESFNALDYFSSPYFKETNFDLIHLSNIFLFMTDQERIFFLKILKKLKTKLSNQGLLVNYFHSFCGELLKNKCTPMNLIYNKERVKQLNLLTKLAKETVEIGKSRNGVGCYSEDLIHIIRK